MKAPFEFSVDGEYPREILEVKVVSANGVCRESSEVVAAREIDAKQSEARLSTLIQLGRKRNKLPPFFLNPKMLTIGGKAKSLKQSLRGVSCLF